MSCIDFIIVSQDLAKHILNATVDSNQLYSLTKYTTTKGIPSIKRSDHHTLLANFSIQWSTEAKARTEVFKLRDVEGLKKFNKMTSKSETLINCAQKNTSVDTACKTWYKEINKLLHQCLKKVRITENPPKKAIEYSIYKLLDENTVLRRLHAECNEMCKPVIKKDIEQNEQKIAILQGNRCKEVISEEMSQFNSNGFFNQNAVWKVKKKIFPKYAEAPFAVYNQNDQLVTDSKGIIQVMKDEFIFRLRNREEEMEYKELRELKEYLCQLRLKITKNSDYNPWTLDDLRKAIDKLKNGKCQDPHGHINELYKHLGESGLGSLLLLLNRIKEELIVPESLLLSNITTIYKGKGSKKNVVNLRGIFKLPIVRNILDKLIHLEDQETICRGIGQFQVGNQKRRSIRDHCLIVHAVVQEAMENDIQLDILFTDIKQCFDSIWLDEAINDLYLSGVETRNLNLLYEGNKMTKMCVESKFGRSDRAVLHNIVMQGSVSGGTVGE